jgi:hypothetical protein
LAVPLVGASSRADIGGYSFIKIQLAAWDILFTLGVARIQSLQGGDRIGPAATNQSNDGRHAIVTDHTRSCDQR